MTPYLPPSDLSPEDEIARLHQVINALIDRHEYGQSTKTDSFHSFQSSVLLEKKIKHRTAELYDTLEELKLMTKKHEQRECELEAAHALLNEAIEQLDEGFVLFDENDCVIACNSKYKEIWGFKKSITGLPFKSLLDQTVDRGVTLSRKKNWRKMRLEQHLAKQSSSVYHFASGKWIQITETTTAAGQKVGIYTDITEVKNNEKQRREAEVSEKNVLLQTSIDSIDQAIVVFDSRGTLLARNNQFTSMLNLPPDVCTVGSKIQLIRPLSPRLFNMPDHLKSQFFSEKQPIEYVISENTTSIKVKAYPMPNAGSVVTFTDISKEAQYQQRIEHLASHDYLTGLNNRASFNDYFNRSLKAISSPPDQFIALLFLDLDSFKDINDTLGHQAGDKVLCEVSNRLISYTPDTAYCARLGGDEFGILLYATDQDEIAIRAQHLLSKLALPMRIEGNNIVIKGSIGITLAPFDGIDPQILLRNSDLAMYEAKKKISFREKYAFYNYELNQLAIERKQLEVDLLDAIPKNQFFMVYQPKLDLTKDSSLYGFEALLRWKHPRRGFVSPDIFIPIAEQTGMICDLSDWVVDTVGQQVAEWNDKGYGYINIAINLSPAQFHYGDPTIELTNMVKKYGLPPSCLEVEITENTIMEGVENAITSLQSIREKGIKIAIDDFGTGYSSLKYLRRLPVDTLKIDKCFVSKIGCEDRDEAIVDTILSLGSILELRIVAEGVETNEQLMYLKEHNCDQVQGYFISKPLIATDVEEQYLTVQ
jgi:diguanylate cyclase (GGDEF)-like protein